MTELPRSKLIVEGLTQYYSKEDPPPLEVKVDVGSIHLDQDVPGYFNAVITLITDYIKLKKHTVKVKFTWNPKYGVHNLSYLT